MNYTEWKAQLPPSDFADRTVRTMLATPPARRSWRRAFGLIGLAAVLAGTSAWGMLAEGAAPEPPRLALEPTLAPRRAPIVIGSEAHAPEAVRAHAVAPLPRPRVAAAPRRQPEPAVTEPPPPELPLVPRCTCELDALICSCVD